MFSIQPQWESSPCWSDLQLIKPYFEPAWNSLGNILVGSAPETHVTYASHAWHSLGAHETRDLQRSIPAIKIHTKLVKILPGHPSVVGNSPWWLGRLGSDLKRLGRLTSVILLSYHVISISFCVSTRFNGIQWFIYMFIFQFLHIQERHQWTYPPVSSNVVASWELPQLNGGL